MTPRVSSRNSQSNVRDPVPKVSAKRAVGDMTDVSRREWGTSASEGEAISAGKVRKDSVKR